MLPIFQPPTLRAAKHLHTAELTFEYGPPGWPFWGRAVLYWVIPYIVGSALIFGRRDTILGEVQERSSTEGAA